MKKREKKTGKRRLLAGLLSLLMIFTTVFTGNVVAKATDTTGQIEVNITGNGTLDYTFYDSNDNICADNATGQINTATGTITIPESAVKMTLKAYGDSGWQGDSASGTKDNTTLSAVDNGIFGEDGVTINDFTNENGFSINLTFTQQQQSGLDIPVGSVGFEISNSQNGKVYYSFTGSDDSWNEIGNNGIIESSAIGTNTTVYVKAVPNGGQSVDATDGANYVDIAGIRTNFSVIDLTSGAALFTYSVSDSHKVHIEFAGSASTANAGDIPINIINAQNGTVQYKIGNGDWQTINGSNFTLRTSDELNGVVSGITILFQATPNQDQSLDTNEGQNWIQIGEQNQAGIDTGKLLDGTYSITYDPTSTYSMQIAFEGGGSNEPENVSFSCSSMNGNENERVNAVEVWLNEADGWVTYSSGVLNSLTENTTFKVRITMKDGFTIDKVSLDYESFDGNSRVGYFKESSQTDYDAIIAALMSDEGYAITFQPEADSKDADNNSTLQADSTCLRLQYQTVIAYDAHVDINLFFQTKNGENGYGVWTIDNNSGEDVFVDGVGDSEVIFSFNDNNYGENGDPFDLGYGKYNTGDSQIQVSYVSAYTGKVGQTVTVTPDTYDYFSAGGYATGVNQNTIHIDNFDGLIDEVYIDVNNNNTFEASEKLTAKTGTDEFLGEYQYYEETLDAAASYNILIRKHLSTRVSMKWSYTEAGTDFYVDHGKIFIEKVVRGNDTLLQAETDINGDLVLTDGVPNTTINTLGNDYGVTATAGEAFLECGDVVTIRLIPTYGYQIKEANLNGVVPLTPNEKVSSFTFTVDGNLHLAGNFIEATDVTDTSDAAKINDASITNGQNATDSGNLKLTVVDHSGTYAEEEQALTLAKGDNANAETVAILDMTLDSMVSKGNGEYWTDNITSFDTPINVNLDLNDTTYEPGDTYVVVREHEGTLSKIETSYENGVLSIPTEKFSTYSIVKIPLADADGLNMHLEYDPRGEGDEAGSVTVKCGDTELTGTDGFYKYDNPAQAITFELKKPADRTDCTPVVEVVFPQENEADTKVIYPTVTDNKFTVTPSTDSGLSGSPFMEVYVHWSEYDRFGPGDGQFMVILRKYSDKDSFVFQNSPTIQGSNSLDDEVKYIFANGTNVSVEIKPGANRELVEVFVDVNEQIIHYSAEPQEGDRDIAELKTSDGEFIVPNLEPWTFVEAICIDLPVLSGIQLTNANQTLYDTMKRSEVSITATCKIGEDVVDGTVELEGGDTLLVAGENEYGVIFTSDVDENGEQFTVGGTITLKVLHNIDISNSESNSGSESSSSSDTPTTPAVTEPEVTTPEVTKPEVTTPTVTEPKVTTPTAAENTTTITKEESKAETKPEKTTGVSSEDGSEGWTDIKTEIKDKLAEAVETTGEEAIVAVEMNGEDTVPADVFETIKGQDITVTFDMGNGIIWAVNGMDVTADIFEDINFSATTGDGVTVIPAELISELTEDRFSMELTLEYEGEFGFTAVMSVNVEKKNAGKYANLFYFNPKAETMEFICSAQVKEDGTADLTFTHASDYVIVVDEVAMSAANNIAKDKVEQSVPQESPVEIGTTEKDAFNPFWIIVIGIVVLLVGGIAILTIKKKND